MVGDGKAVFSAAASVADPSGNTSSASERNVLILDSVSDIATSPASQSLLDAVLKLQEKIMMESRGKVIDPASAPVQPVTARRQVQKSR